MKHPALLLGNADLLIEDRRDLERFYATRAWILPNGVTPRILTPLGILTDSLHPFICKVVFK